MRVIPPGLLVDKSQSYFLCEEDEGSYIWWREPDCIAHGGPPEPRTVLKNLSQKLPLYNI